MSQQIQAGPSSFTLNQLVVDATSIAFVDGEQGKLYYRGYDVEELCQKSTFEESACLLLLGFLPPKRLNGFLSQRMHAAVAAKPDRVVRIIDELPHHSHPLIGLQVGLAALSSIYMEYGLSNESLFDQCLRLIASTPLLLALHYRHSIEAPVPKIRPELGHVENFLYLIQGVLPKKEDVSLLQKLLILQMENGFDCSTFTARASSSTLSNFFSAASAAVGALSGSLHGAAADKVYEMLLEIRNEGSVDEYLARYISAGATPPGIGHRVYAHRDPRAATMEQFFKDPKAPRQLKEDYLLLCEIRERWAEKTSRKVEEICTSLEFWTPSLYSMIGIPSSLFSSVFAVARVVGWASHMLELRQRMTVYRPRENYVGPKNLKYIEESQR